MNRPVRLQLSRARGFNLHKWSLEKNGLAAVKVDRTTLYGNPYRIGEPVDRKQVNRWGWEFSRNGLLCTCKDDVEATAKFRHCLIWDEAIHGFIRRDLGGKNLACWCEPDAACHADALLFVANSTPEEIHRIHRATDEAILRACT